MALIDKLIKNSKIKGTGYLRDSDVFNKAHKFIPTDVKMMNVATSGDLNGGLTPGILTIAGPSKHFKTAFAMVLAAAFQKKHPDGVILFYDSEFGSTEAYFNSFDIDIDRVVHTPIPNIEELKFDIAAQLEGIEKDEPVFILIDSIGNLASKKEAEDALDGKSVADMTRAKQLKSMWRIVTPQIAMKSLYCVNINHTYKTMELYAKDVVSGGTGGIYSSDAIWIVNRRQTKEGTEIIGYEFVIKIEKSRFVKEGTKIPISVTFDGGINKWSGMFDVAVAGGYIDKPKVGWYMPINPETGECLSEKNLRQKEIAENEDFWKMMLEKTDFAEYVKGVYTLGGKIHLEDDAFEVMDPKEEKKEIEEIEGANDQ